MKGFSRVGLGCVKCELPIKASRGNVRRGVEFQEEIKNSVAGDGILKPQGWVRSPSGGEPQMDKKREPRRLPGQDNGKRALR